MTYRARLIRLGVGVGVVNSILIATAAALASNPQASEAAHRLLVLCRLGG